MAYEPSAATWIKITKTFSDFSTAGLTNSLTIYTLPAKGVVHSVIMKHSTSFSGGSIATYTISVGKTGSLQAYVTNSNVLQASSATLTFQPVSAMIPITYDSGTTTNIIANAISTVANLNAATQGSTDIYLLISNLP